MSMNSDSKASGPGNARRSAQDVAAGTGAPAWNPGSLIAELNRKVVELDRASMELEKLAGIVETSQDSIISKDLDGNIISWNAAAERIFGYRREEAIGKSIAMIIPVDQMQQWRELHARLLRGEAVDPVDTVRMGKHGQLVELHVAYSQMRDRSGKVIGISSIGRDVSHLKAIEREAVRRAAQVEAIMAAVPAVVWIAHDREGNTITGNREAYRLLRMPEGVNQSLTAGAAERPTHFRFMKDGRELVDGELPVQKASRTGVAVEHWQTDVVFDNGDVRHILGNAVPVPGEDQQPRGAVAAFIDVTELTKSRAALDRVATELKQRVAELEAARQAADEANDSKDRFIAVLSHELRTPLTPVLSAIRLASRDKARLPADVQRLLQLIERNVTIEARLIDDLLDLNRLSRGMLTLHRRQVSVARAIEESVEFCRLDAERTEVGIKVQADEDLWVNADPARLNQIIWNLLRNAIRHSDAGSSISVVARRGDRGMVMLEIIDTGDGIDPRLLPTIFNAFERGEGRRGRPTDGLGLGLAICKSLVAMHEGQIEAASEGVGRGARFTVTLPAVDRAADSRGHPGDTHAREQEILPKYGNHKVLFVEDNADTAMTTAMLLSMYGLEVTTAGTMADALQRIDQQQFDIIVSDIGLPDGNGLELMQRVRAAGHTLPAIAMSGYGMEADVRKSKAAGFNVHLVKPVDISRLESAIEDLL
jgi:two-component system CheB/CheR fusion protein